MTGKELFSITKPQINVETANDYTDSQLLSALNSALINLNLLASDVANRVLTVTSTDFVTLTPTNIIKVLTVFDSLGKRYYDWETLDGKIKFKTTGTYTLYYTVPFPQMVSTSNYILIHELYLPALQSAIKSIFWEQEEEMEKATYFDEKAQGQARAAFAKLQSVYTPNRIKAVRR